MALEMQRICGSKTDDAGPIRDVLSRVGDKWSVLIVGMLEEGPLRFTAILRLVPGISQRMLTHTLRNLERDGLVSRHSYPEIPPRVEYAITELGQTLLPALLSLARWAHENHETIEAHRDAYDEALDA
jgi:DNA-binding HxlR family transcriptional regulator